MYSEALCWTNFRFHKVDMPPSPPPFAGFAVPAVPAAAESTALPTAAVPAAVASAATVAAALASATL